jgi:hypothetical protein
MMTPLITGGGVLLDGGAAAKATLAMATTGRPLRPAARCNLSS